jgi:hypothetical protein
MPTSLAARQKGFALLCIGLCSGGRGHGSWRYSAPCDAQGKGAVSLAFLRWLPYIARGIEIGCSCYDKRARNDRHGRRCHDFALRRGDEP